MIETNRLLLKPLSICELKKHLESPGDLAHDMGLIPSRSIMDAETREAIMKDLLPNLEDPDKDALFYTLWLIIEKSSRSIIGGICFHGEPDAKGEVEIGYGTDEEFRNQGYMTETIEGIIGWARNHENIKVIKAETSSLNVASVNVLLKNGFEVIRRDENQLLLKLDLHKNE